MPLATLVYLFLPVDLLPDPVLGLGQVDDLVLILLGLKMFVSLCPPDVVAELEGGNAKAEEAAWRPSVEEIIDVEPQLPEEASPEDSDRA